MLDYEALAAEAVRAPEMAYTPYFHLKVGAVHSLQDLLPLGFGPGNLPT